jgi:hypothetical protein
MYIEEYSVEVFDSVWNEKTKKMSKEKSVVASLKDTTGICSKHLGKWLDDLSDNPTFRGEKITLHIKIEKGEE